MSSHLPVPAPVERPTTIYLDDQEWLTVQTTPVDLHDWAVGYLFGEGVIDHPDDLLKLVAEEERGLVWADLRRPAKPDSDPAAGSGVLLTPVGHALQADPERLLLWMKEMLDSAVLYAETGGMHVAAAFRSDTGRGMIREDIGRHNAVDKVIGACLKAGWPAEQVVILTSGRISYEMCSRLARFGAAIGVSRTAATDQAWALATQLGIELVGYARNASLTVYTDGKRIRGRNRDWNSTAANS